VIERRGRGDERGGKRVEEGGEEALTALVWVKKLIFISSTYCIACQTPTIRPSY
jgi:hypothetical protein